ncbi:hypothetical protein F7Q95_21950 [Pseudomonas psychrophila]|nr:hypothetical protein F7Q95_21950 [Pseudomonas psychrophila]
MAAVAAGPAVHHRTGRVLRRQAQQCPGRWIAGQSDVLTPWVYCGSGLARDAITAVLQSDRGDSIASKPAPTGMCGWPASFHNLLRTPLLYSSAVLHSIAAW